MKIKSIIAVLICSLLSFSLTAPSIACPPPDCGDCYTWNSETEECEWDCTTGQCCDDGVCVDNCDAENCEECVAGDCEVCGGDTSKFCCDGNCCISNCEVCVEGNCVEIDVNSVTSDVDVVCVGCWITFTATTNPSGHQDKIEWSAPGGDPNSGSGSSIHTRWVTAGTKTVTASICDNNDSNQVTIAYPTNFRETYWEDLGDGVLYFEYMWDSSTGDLNDLSGCRVGEVVYYPGTSNPYIAPDPPFDLWEITNPTRKDVDATLGELADMHGKGGGFSKPYCDSGFGAKQWYEYLTCFGGPINLEDHDIDRSVYQFDPLDPNSVWQYKVEKSGHFSTMDLP